MAYNHGVRVKEQATSLVAPVTGTAGLQVIIGTAPVNLAADPYKATNVPMIAYSFSEAVEQVGYSDDFKNYTLCQSMDACFRVLNVAPIILINVLDPKKHKKANEEQTVNVEKMQATVKVAGILAESQNGGAGNALSALVDKVGAAMQGSTQTPISGLLDRLSGGGNEPQPATANGAPINYAPVYNFNGAAPTKDDLVEAERMSQAEFNEMMEQWQRDNDRKRF